MGSSFSMHSRQLLQDAGDSGATGLLLVDAESRKVLLHYSYTVLDCFQQVVMSLTSCENFASVSIIVCGVSTISLTVRGDLILSSL